MKKKKYIRPLSIVIEDAGISLMDSSKWLEDNTYAIGYGVFKDDIDDEISYVTSEYDIPDADAKMHDLWEEW